MPIRTIQTKPILFSLFFFVCMFALHKLPLAAFLQNTLGYTAVFATMASKLIFNIIIIGSAYLLCVRTDNTKLGGLQLLTFRNFYLFALPVLYICLMTQNFARVRTVESPDFFSPLMLLFFFKSLSIGFLEEVTFRSLFQSLILKKYHASHGIYFCVTVTSLLFGFGHIINLINLNYSLIGVFSQIAFAFCVGFLFSSLVIATQNVYPIGIIHALNHFSSNIILVFPQYFANPSTADRNSSTLEIAGSVLLTLVIFGIPTIVPSYYILNRFKPVLS